MRIARGLLLAVLEAASPALGTARNLVPGLSHFWFDRESVTAFNDVLGIRVTFESDFTGGVEGERLLGLLKNSTARNVTLEARTKGRNPVLSVELGTTGVLLPMRPIAELLFHEKFPDDSRVFAVGSEFIDALKLTMLSCVAKKLASPAERGVTLIQKGMSLDVFTTDDATVSWVRVEEQPLFTTAPGRAIWPREFCDYFIRHFTTGTRVAMAGGAVWCTGGVPQKSTPLDVTVYAKLIEDNTPSDFAGFVRRHEGEVAVAFKIPDDLSHALSRAAVMLPEKSPIELEVTTVTGQEMTDPDIRVLRLYANSTAGEFDDLMEIDANGHADLTVRVDAGLIRRALAGRTALAITGGVVVLTGPPGFFHFISIRR
jgi:hypothetical protein